MINNTNQQVNKLLLNYVNMEVKDIYIIGYSEVKEKFNFFSPMLWWYYIEFEHNFLCLDSSNESKQLQVYSSESIQCQFEIEEQDIFTVMSLEKGLSSKLLKFEIFFTQQSSNIFALGIQLKQRYLFFDFLDWNGIRIGNEIDKKRFMQESNKWLVDIIC